MVGSGRTLYHLTYIDDLIQGMVLAASRPEAVGEVFTIAGEKYTTLNELVEMIGVATGGQLRRISVPLKPVMWAASICDKTFRLFSISPPLYPRRVEFFALDRAFSIQKAKKLLGYQPKFNLEEGLALTADWYRTEGFI
jgi:nucleoside-diphosphate-sugar epimerase